MQPSKNTDLPPAVCTDLTPYVPPSRWLSDPLDHEYFIREARVMGYLMGRQVTSSPWTDRALFSCHSSNPTQARLLADRRLAEGQSERSSIVLTGVQRLHCPRSQVLLLEDKKDDDTRATPETVFQRRSRERLVKSRSSDFPVALDLPAFLLRNGSLQWEGGGGQVDSPVAGSSVSSSSASIGLRAPSTSRMAPDVAVLSGVSLVKDSKLPEQFFISSFPNQQQYWAWVASHEIEVGVQLQLKDYTGATYHPVRLPGEEARIFDNLRVRLIESKPIVRDGVAVEWPGVQRIYEIIRDGYPVRQFVHFTLPWPDFGVPRETDFFTMMKVYAEHVRQGTKVHVHCMGGRGRSGTFVYTRILSIYPELHDDEPAKILRALRAQRPGLVETETQRIFAERYAHILAGRVVTFAPLVPSSMSSSSTFLPLPTEPRQRLDTRGFSGQPLSLGTVSNENLDVVIPPISAVTASAVAAPTDATGTPIPPVVAVRPPVPVRPAHAGANPRNGWTLCEWLINVVRGIPFPG